MKKIRIIYRNISRKDAKARGSFLKMEGDTPSSPPTGQHSFLRIFAPSCEPLPWRRRSVALQLSAIFFIFWTLGVSAQDNPLAKNARFVRGTGTDPQYQSLVIPLDFQKGVALDPMGLSPTNLGGRVTWVNQISKEQRKHFDQQAAAAAGGGQVRTFNFENPIAIFGRSAGGTPLYVNQAYRFGAFGGMRNVSVPSGLADIRIRAYPRSALTNGVSNVAPIGEFSIFIPRKGTPNWEAFASKGFSRTWDWMGLQTTLQLVEGQWWQQWGVLQASPILLTHRATSPDNVYVVEMRGNYYWGNGEKPMVTATDGITPSWSGLYSLEFDTLSPWQSTLIQTPHFSGDPLPPGYYGKTTSELLSVAPTITATPPLAPSSYTQLDQSPELRRHPLLDQFVADMANDPIALANYVQNEIELTDPISYAPDGTVSDVSLSAGGVNRGALGVFLEGQGSPVEQCALLVYLLRQAGVPATFVNAPHNGVKMLDVQLSKMLQMQIRGAVNSSGQSNVPTLIPVNYPWVAAYINNQWVHLFPWIKDVELIEGRNVYDFLPQDYNSGSKWTRQYLYGDTNIMSLDDEDDSPESLFPKFIAKQLKDNYPTVRPDDLGVKVTQRRNLFSRWQDFPKPFAVTNALTALESFGMTSNIFDTVTVEVSSVANPAKKVTSGELRMADIHNRKFLIRQEKIASNTIRLTLSLGAYRPSVANDPAVPFENIPVVEEIKKRQVTVDLVNPQDDVLRVKIRHRKLRTLPSEFTPTNAFLNLRAVVDIQDEASLRLGDMAAICLDTGRVNDRMMREHAEEFWRFQRFMQQNPTATIDPELFPGTPLYLMGMNYFAKVDRFRPVNERLHKFKALSWWGDGLAIFGATRDNGFLPFDGEVSLTRPMVNMFVRQAAGVANGTLHPDAEYPEQLTANDFFSVAIANASAQEHRILDTFFLQENAVSTVKLLQIAEQRKGAGRPGILNLNSQNYQTYGTTSFDGKLLKDHDPWIWGVISSALNPNSASAASTQVYATPGMITNSFYKGMGAMILSVTNRMSVSSGGAVGTPSSNLGDFNGRVVFDPGSSGGNLFYTPSGGGFGSGDFSYFWGPTDLSGFFGSPTTYWTRSNVYDPSRYTASQTIQATPFTRQAASQTAQALGVAYDGSAPTLASVQNKNVNVGSVSKTTFFGNAKDFVEDPVNVMNGEFYHDVVDLTLSGPMPLDLRRNYQSQNLADGSFSFGWKLNVVPYLVVSDKGTIYASEMNGSTVAYTPQPTNSNLWLPSLPANPMLTSDGVGSANLFNARLERLTSTNYTLTGPDGSRRFFSVRSYPLAGTNPIPRSRPYLDRWEDAQGNFLTFTFGTDTQSPDYGELKRIDASNGNFLGFRYDVYAHIVEAFTRDGRRVQYEYDNQNDLVGVMLPDASTVRYEYEHGSTNLTSGVQFYSNHLMTREVKPEGRLLENTYDPSRRVIEQRATVSTNSVPVRNATFVYTGAGTTNNAPTGATLVIDVFNRTNSYAYASGLVTNITDALGRTTAREFYATNAPPIGYPRSLKRETDPRGLVTEFQYDPRGNLTRLSRKGDLTGSGTGGETSLQTFAYNSLNLMTQAVDPSGNKLSILYEDPLYPRLPTTVEHQSSGSVLIGRNRMEYEAVTDPVSGAQAKGLLKRLLRAAATTDEAITEWTHDARGFVTSQIQRAGGTGIDVTMNFTRNLRGELVEASDALGRKSVFAYDGRGNRIWEERRDENGLLVGWNYDYFNHNGEIEWSDGPRYNPEDYTWRRYDGAGRLSEEVRWRSRAKDDASGVEAETGDTLLSTTKYKYDLFGNLTEIQDPRGNFVTMTYDAMGQLLSRNHQNSQHSTLSSQQISYEPGGQVNVLTNALGGVTKLFYNTAGQPRRRENPDGSVQEWRYFLDGRLQKEVFSNGSYALTTYDDAARSVTRTLYGPDKRLLKSEVSLFDRRGNTIQTMDAEGNIWTATFDGLDRVLVASGPAGSAQQRITSTYDNAGKTLITVNALGESTTTIFDALGRPVSVEVKSSLNVTVRKRTYVYSADQHSVAITDGTGGSAVTTTQYTDVWGAPVLTKFAGGAWSSSTYDVGGNLVRTRDELNRANGFIPDALGRVTTQTLSDGGIVTFTYDAANNLLTRSMPGNLVWVATYDNAGRLRTEQLQNGASVTRNFTYNYFASGPFVGLLQNIVDPRGITRTRTYDDFLRVKGESCAGASDAAMSIEYDKLGRLTRARQWGSTIPESSVDRVYDGNGQPLDESVRLNGALHSHFTQTWNAAGRRFSLAPASDMPTQGTGAGRQWIFTWRADDLLTQVTDKAGRVYSFTINDAGLLNGRSNPWRALNVASRDTRGRATQINTTAGGATPLSETLTWRADSSLDLYTANRTGTGSWNETRDYDYDTRGRLTLETFKPASTGGNRSLGYTFDSGTGGGLGVLTRTTLDTTNSWSVPVGGLDAWQRVKSEVSGQSARPYLAKGVTRGADSVKLTLDGTPADPVQFNASNASTNWSANVTLTPGQHTLTATGKFPGGSSTSTNSVFVVSGATTVTNNFDAVGNVISRTFADGRVQTLTWDPWNRLTKVVQRDAQTNGFDWVAMYDPFGRRLSTTYVPVTAGSLNSQPSTLSSFYDPEVEFLEIGLALNGNRYWKVYGNDLNGVYGGLQGIGGLESIIRESDGTTEGVIADSSGNIVARVPTAGGIATWLNAKVGAYGPLPGFSSPPLESLSTLNIQLSTALAWQGRRLDPTGFFYCGARYYDPTAGRFISADPLGHGADMSLYSLCWNDPVNAVDPDGRCLEKLKDKIWPDRVTARRGENLAHALMGSLYNKQLQIGRGGPDAYFGRAMDALDNDRPFDVGEETGRTDLAMRFALQAQRNEFTISTKWKTDVLETFAMVTPVGLEENLIFKELGLTRVTAGAFKTEETLVKLERGAATSTGPTSLWTKTEFKGTRVYQRNDLINPNLTDKLGRSNLQRMREGLAPLGPDGKPINLHHMLQTADSPIAEVTQTFHQQNSRIIHINPSTTPSGIDRSTFYIWRADYWMNRVNDF